MASLISSNDLRKIYPDGTAALRGIDMEIDVGGKVVGIMGPNGAGKTTLVRIMSTQLKPTSGEMRVLGYDVVREAELIRERISVLPQDMTPFFYTTTPREDIYHVLRMRGLPHGESMKLVREVLDKLGPGAWADSRVERLSGGNIKRYLIALSLAPPADLYILDEPTTGLDPINRRKVWSLILDKAREGAGVIITSHLLEELMILSHEVIFIFNGEIVDIGSPRLLMQEYIGDNDWKIVLKVSEMSEGDLKTVEAVLERMHGTTRIRFQDTINIYPENEEALHELEVLLEKESIRFRKIPVSLEDAYLIVTLSRGGDLEGS